MTPMTTTILAHGGQMTADEIAMVAGGLFFAMAFPAVALLIAMRRGRRHQDEPQTEGVKESC